MKYSELMRNTTMLFSITARSFGFMLCAATGVAHANETYTWVCDAADCNGDPAFTSTIEITDSAFTVGDFTGVAGNVASWNTTSGVGDGYSVSLAHILTGPAGSNEDDINNLRIVLSADKSEITLIQDTTAGTNITFDDIAEGRVDFFEGTSYSVGSLRDGPVGSPFSSIIIQGRFVLDTVPPSAATCGNAVVENVEQCEGAGCVSAETCTN